jgi:acetylornithine/N-succinyldiaminopimelate aminotransferase
MGHLLWYPGHDIRLLDIVRAENCRLYDAQGKTYIDLESGVWCTSVGHGHPRVVRALTEQAGRIAHTGYCYSNRVVEETAQEVLELLGFSGGKCVFLCSGSETVEYGVRVAQTGSGRPLLMTMTDSYFGAYGSASARRADEWFSFDWAGCAGCPAERACDRACPRWATIPWERIGGFLFEPGSSSGLVRFPPVKLVQAVVRTVKANDGLVLVNEVTTGVGRTGLWFGYQHYGIEPDVVATGKGIGNGYPVSVAAFAPRAAARLGGGPLKYAQSHQNDPLGAAVVREVLHVIREEGLIERGREIGLLLRAGLEEVRAHAPRLREVRSRGLMVALSWSGDDADPYAWSLQRQLLERGFILACRPGLGVMRIDPALTIEREEIERFLETLGNLAAA